jgi:hypothetical protein
MPRFNSQIDWQAISATAVAELATLLALAFAVVGYIQWSSNAEVAEFMSTIESPASDPSQSIKSPDQIKSLQGPTGCPLGKRSPPTRLLMP